MEIFVFKIFPLPGLQTDKPFIPLAQQKAKGGIANGSRNIEQIALPCSLNI